MPKFARWYAATTCTGSARPGAKALMRYVLDEFSRAANWGIYNCRSVRGSATTSPHGEGRAIDVGFPTSGGRGSKYGYALVNAILKAGPHKLGVQAVIYDRTIWSAKSPDGRRYTGSHPHYDHVHVEITRTAAEKMTLATVRSVLGGSSSGSSGSSKYESYKSKAKAGSRTVGRFSSKPWSAGADVKELQRILNAWYPRQTALKNDGYFGPKTEDRVEYLQRKAGIAVDGFVGPVTWRVLGVR